MIEAGTYRGQAVQWAFGKAGTGNHQIGVRFVLLDLQNQWLNWYGSFTEAALEFTVKALRAMGWEGTDLGELDNCGGGLDRNEVLLVVEHEEGLDGVVRPKIKWVNSQGGLGLKDQLDSGSVKAFAASMRGKIMALDPGRRPAAASASSQARRPAPQQRQLPQQANGTPPWGEEPPPPSDTDIPF